MKVYLAFENDYDRGYDLLGVFDNLSEAQSLCSAYRVELWEDTTLKQPWEKKNGGWMKVAW